MAIEQARDYLKAWGCADQIIELEHSSATVALAAEALGTEEARIAKTLSFWVQEQPVLVVTAGDQKIDNAKYKAFFHVKAKMLSYEEVVLDGIRQQGFQFSDCLYCDALQDQYTVLCRFLQKHRCKRCCCNRR